MQMTKDVNEIYELGQEIVLLIIRHWGVKYV